MFDGGSIAAIISYKAPLDKRLLLNVSRLKAISVRAVLACADDNSFQGLPDELKPLVVSIGDGGIYDGWNKAIESLRGKVHYVTFFGKDDLIECEKFFQFLSQAISSRSAFHFAWKGKRLPTKIQEVALRSHRIVHPGSVYDIKVLSSQPFSLFWPINSDLDLNLRLINERGLSVSRYNGYAKIGGLGVSSVRYLSVLHTLRIRQRHVGNAALWSFVIDTVAFGKRRVCFKMGLVSRP